MYKNKHIWWYVVPLVCFITFGSCNSKEDGGFQQLSIQENKVKNKLPGNMVISGKKVFIRNYKSTAGYFSKDNGQSWTKRTSSPPLGELILGDDNRIRGYHSWKGIHEPSRAYISYSDDWGKSWIKVELNPNNIIPVGFVNKEGHRLLILDEKGRVWTNKTNKPKREKDFKIVFSSNPDKKGVAGVISSKGIYVSSKDHIWLRTKKMNRWESADKKVVNMAIFNNQVWAVSNSGIVYKSTDGENDWKVVTTIKDISIVLDSTVCNGKFVVVGRDSEPRSKGVIIEENGKMKEIMNLPGKSCRSVISEKGKHLYFITTENIIKYSLSSGTKKNYWP